MFMSILFRSALHPAILNLTSSIFHATHVKRMERYFENLQTLEFIYGLQSSLYFFCVFTCLSLSSCFYLLSHITLICWNDCEFHTSEWYHPMQKRFQNSLRNTHCCSFKPKAGPPCSEIPQPLPHYLSHFIVQFNTQSKTERSRHVWAAPIRM